MKNLLIFDAETTGTDPKKDKVLEVGAVLWNVPHRSIVECFSGLLPATSNPAEHVNGIPSGILKDERLGGDPSSVRVLWSMVQHCDAIVAHNAEFDRSFMDEEAAGFASAAPWICTIEDLQWPKPSPSKSLIALALAHGCAVTSAHRAIHDCLLLARCFETIPDIADRLSVALEHALLPKGEVISLAPFEEKDVVKEHGFHWDPARKVWHRTMALADAEKLPFRTQSRRHDR